MKRYTKQNEKPTNQQHWYSPSGHQLLMTINGSIAIPEWVPMKLESPMNRENKLFYCTKRIFNVILWHCSTLWLVLWRLKNVLKLISSLMHHTLSPTIPNGLSIWYSEPKLIPPLKKHFKIIYKYKTIYNHSLFAAIFKSHTFPSN